MIQKLSKLHSRLHALRRRRRALRWATGYSALAVALLWLLAALFLADWLLRMNRPERIVGMVICLGLLVWAARRYSLPWFGHRETELDVALMVEKQEHIDTDVVAAIQFESPEAPQWGSVRLEEAVIERTARLGEQLHVTEGIPRSPLRHRAVALLCTCAVLGLGVWQFPDYARVFLNRLLLGSLHYPSRTSIESLRINGRPVDLGAWRIPPVKVSYGKPVRFEVTCTGELPESGEISMKTLRGGVAATLAIQPAARHAGPAQDPSPPAPLLASEARGAAIARLYAGELPKLPDSVAYQVYVGDAWTDPAELLLVSPPVIEVRLDVTPPQYAAAEQDAAQHPLGMRQIAVLEGSQVTVRISSDKPLKQARVELEGQAHPMVRDREHPLIENQECWKLDPAQTPLASVTQLLHYAIQATDADDLELERPIQGVIRIREDQAPRVSASIVTKVVLPTARPTVSYTASDDFGLAEIAILPEVTRANQTSDQRADIVAFRLAQGQDPNRLAQEDYALDLAPLKLVKGDQLKIRVRATDYRGPAPGKSSVSEPLVLEVTDEAGILAAIAEADKESARQLRIMIERQIDVGEGR